MKTLPELMGEDAVHQLECRAQEHIKALVRWGENPPLTCVMTTVAIIHALTQCLGEDFDTLWEHYYREVTGEVLGTATAPNVPDPDNWGRIPWAAPGTANPATGRPTPAVCAFTPPVNTGAAADTAEHAKARDLNELLNGAWYTHREKIKEILDGPRGGRILLRALAHHGHRVPVVNLKGLLENI